VYSCVTLGRLRQPCPMCGWNYTLTITSPAGSGKGEQGMTRQHGVNAVAHHVSREFGASGPTSYT
jgi:hypothetical protein